MKMFAIPLLILLYMPTVTSQLFDINLCGTDQEMVCLVQDTCRGEDKENRLMPVDRRHNYVHCPVHVILKQYNTKSYLVRFITNSSEIKLTTFDGEQFGCRLKQDIIDVIHSDNVDIDLCDSNTLEFDGPKFKEGGFFVMHVNARVGDVTCPHNYTMTFSINDDKIRTASSISCQKETPKCTEECKWKYSIMEEGNKKPIMEYSSLKAACRAKVCKLCGSPSLKCVGDDCSAPFLVHGMGEDCDRFQCQNGNNFVQIGEDNNQLDEITCTHEKGTFNFAWKIADKKIEEVTCSERFPCDNNLTLSLDCATGNECPTIDPETTTVTCAEGSSLSLIPSKGEKIWPSKIQCDYTKGAYQYKEGEGEFIPLDTATYQVTCARKGDNVSSAGFSIWIWIGIGIVVGMLIVVVLIVCCRFFILRSKRISKEEEERKNLITKKSESQTSSTASQAKPGVSLPIPTPSTSNEKSDSSGEKNNDLPEKTMIEPTVTVNTAFSRETHSVHKSKDISIEEDDDKIDKKDEKTMQVKEKSAGSVKGSHASQKEKKEERKRKDDNKPRKFDLDDKEKKIAKGVYRKNEDYPTMADIESDWDDDKDGKHVSKQKTKTNEIPTAKTPSIKRKKTEIELNEKTAEFDKLMTINDSDTKVNRPKPEEKDDSNVSVRRKNDDFTHILKTLEETQDQK